jgi:hypothetical protein
MYTVVGMDCTVYTAQYFKSGSNIVALSWSFRAVRTETFIVPAFLHNGACSCLVVREQGGQMYLFLYKKASYAGVRKKKLALPRPGLCHPQAWVQYQP